MRPIRALALAFVALAASAGTAAATSTVDCEATDKSEALVEMNFSDSLPVDRPNWVRIVDGKEKWSTLGGVDADWTPAAILQSFDDGTLFSLDVSDDQQSEVIAHVRILNVEEGGKFVRLGVLHLPGRSVHPISCNYGDE